MEINFVSLSKTVRKIQCEPESAAQISKGIADYLSSLLDSDKQDNRDLVDAKDADGYYLIHWAAVTGDVSLMQRLLELGSNLNQISDNNSQVTPTFFVIKLGHAQLLDFLFKNDVFTNQIDKNKCNLGHLAASFNQVNILDMLINKWNVAIHFPDLNGHYPIQSAALANSTEAFRFLVENGHPMDQPFNGELLTHFAIKRQNRKLFQLLVENGANFTCQDRWGDYPLHLAVVANQLEFVDLLLTLKVPLSQIDRLGKLAIHLAVFERNAVMIKKLLVGSRQCDYKTQLSQHDADGNPLVHSIILHLNDEDLSTLLPLLLEMNAYTWWHNDKNESPVMLAIKHVKIHALKYLLENQKKIKASFIERGYSCPVILQEHSNSGKAPIHYAVKLLMNSFTTQEIDLKKIEEIFCVLRQYGVSFLQRTMNDTTARQMLFESTLPRGNSNLWQNIISMAMQENEQDRELVQGLIYSNTKEKAAIIASLLRNILRNEQANICLNYLSDFINRDANQKIALTIMTCTLILKFYGSIITSDLRNFNILTLLLFKELCEEQNLDPHYYFPYQTIRDLAISLVKKIIYIGYIPSHSVSPLNTIVDNFLYFVCVMFPKYYIQCLFDSYKALSKYNFYRVRLISEHGLGIKFRFDQLLKNLKIFGHGLFSKYEEDYKAPFSYFFIKMPIGSEQNRFIDANQLALDQALYLSSKYNYSEQEIVSYLHIFSSILISNSQFNLNSAEIIGVKNTFFYFFLLSESLLENRKYGDDNNSVNQFKLQKIENIKSMTDSRFESFHEHLSLEQLILLALKKLMRNIDSVRSYFSANELVILHKKIYQRFPTLIDICINKLCEMEASYEEGAIDKEISNTAILIFDQSKTLNSRARFLSTLGVFAKSNDHPLIAVNYEDVVKQVLFRI
jgi:ankyrin repeat protein